MTSPFHSLRWRLQTWHGFILFLVILAFCLTAYQLATDNQKRRVGRDMHRLERVLMGGIFESVMDSLPEDEGFTPAKFVQALRDRKIGLSEHPLSNFQGNDTGYAYFRIYDTDGSILLESSNVPAELTFSPDWKPDHDEFRHKDNILETIKTSPEGLTTIIGRDITSEEEDMYRLTLSLVFVGLGVWSLGLVGGWWLAGKTIKPIDSISKTATHIADGNLDQRIEIKGTANELDRLAKVLNQTFERLHQTFVRERRFTSDASHELRTPVTILLTETERILKRERSTEEYTEALRTCHDSAERMRVLIEALLLLTRQENLVPLLQDCALNELVDKAVQALSPIARDKQVEIKCDLTPTQCRADAASLSILINNLLSNALEYGASGKEISIHCKTENGKARLCIEDRGPGIPQEDLDHVFERFYRADKARTGDSGHSGLGLAIAKTIIDKHEGTITVENLQPHGCRFTVTLPQ